MDQNVDGEIESFYELRIKFGRSWRAWYKYFCLTIKKSHGNLVVRCNYNAIPRVKLIAKLLSWLVRVISDLAVCGHFIVVCESNKNIASSECVEWVIAPALDMWRIPDLIILSNSHQSLDISVKRVVWVKRCPERLTIGRIITSFKALLRAIINNGDSLRVNNKCQCWFEQRDGISDA